MNLSEEFRTEVHSISKLYEVDGQFLDELQTRLENTRLKLVKLKKKKQVSKLKSKVSVHMRKSIDFWSFNADGVRGWNKNRV